MRTQSFRTSRFLDIVHRAMSLRVGALPPGMTFQDDHVTIINFFREKCYTNCFDSAFRLLTRSTDFPDCPCPTTLAIILSTNCPDFSPSAVFDNLEYSNTSLRLMRHKFIENSLVFLKICSIFSPKSESISSAAPSKVRKA